jgi:RNA polymerase sigma-70 factor (sigma-E family)
MGEPASAGSAVARHGAAPRLHGEVLIRACNLGPGCARVLRVRWQRRREEAEHDADFEAYVLRSRDRLVRFAALLAAGDVYRGEDAVQIALTRVYLAWPRLHAADKVDAYVRRAIVNAVIDEHRRQCNRREIPSAEVPDVTTATVVSTHPSGELLAALSELPMRMRSVVVLRYLEDRSVTETARLLGCSEGTVKSQAARAVAKLRNRLELASQGVDAPTFGAARIGCEALC